MIRLKDSPYANTAHFLEGAIRIAEFYGFRSLEKLLEERKRGNRLQIDDKSEIAYARRDERMLASAARACLMAGAGRGTPLFTWRVNAAQPKNAPFGVSLELHILGIPTAIAEAMLIMMADAIAAESGIANRIISINSIGTPDSSNRYVRDIGTFLKKHIESISPALRPKAAEDPLGTLIQLIERGHPAAVRAPQAMEYLTEEERRRFFELLELLEVAGLRYEANGHVLGSRDCWSHTLFEILWTDEESGARIPVARGGRYDPLISRFAGSHAHGAAVSIYCEVKGRTNVKRSREMSVRPAFYFAHLGPEARRKVLPTLELLRHADILVYQSLRHEKIGEQMAEAKNLGTPYLLIMGHKEAVEGTILVREVATNSQRAVSVEELPSFLRRQRVRA